MKSRNVFHSLIILATLTVVGCPSPPPELPAGPWVHWLRFAQASDMHITDDESPARGVRIEPLVTEAWRPQEAYTTQVLDATVRALNEYHAAGQKSGLPLDFVLFTGDVAEDAQLNELRWFIDTVDGQWVTPDSGVLDGMWRPVLPEDNPKLGFQATGLAPDIPWYVVFGNHDAHMLGTFAVDRSDPDPAEWWAPLLWPLPNLVGLQNLEPPSDGLPPTADQSPAVITGDWDVADPETLALLFGDLHAGPIAADPDRQFVSRKRFMKEFFQTWSEPLGHGFAEANCRLGHAWYSVRPMPAIPVRVIVLDTVAPDPPFRAPMHYGVMIYEQFNGFLKPEIEAARDAGEYVLIVSHHPSSDFVLPYWRPTVDKQTFNVYLASQPHIIAHICGHNHRNQVTWIQGEYPYPEIETASLIDYPQEVRVFDIYHSPDTGAIRVECVTLSHMVNPTRLSEESYRRAVVDTGPAKAAQAAPLIVDDTFGEPAIEWPVSAPTRTERLGQSSDRYFSFELVRPQLKRQTATQ